jgi:hypothetical protein
LTQPLSDFSIDGRYGGIDRKYWTSLSIRWRLKRSRNGERMMLLFQRPRQD